MKEQWIEDIAKMMDGYEMDAPELSWAEIEAKVARNRRSRIVAMWQRRIAVAASLLMIVAATTTLFFDGEGKSDTMARTDNASTPIANESTPIANESEPSNGKIVAQSNATSSGNNRAKRAHQKNLLEISKNPLEILENLLEVSEKHQEIADSGKVVAENVNATSEKAKETPTKTSSAPKEKKKTSLDYPEEYSPRKQKRSRLMASAYFGNGVSLGSVFGSDVVDNELFYDATVNERPDSARGDIRPSYQSGYERSVVNVNHHKPIRIGLSVKYALDDRWAVETGMVYSYLRSDFDEEYNACTLVTKQKIGYIGVPLAANYRIASPKPFNFYVSVGTMLEIPVMAKAEESIISNGITTVSQEHSLSRAGLQLSLSGRLGAEYNVTPLLGIYVEPGVSYYFDNGSSLETYYSDKPLNFNLNLGVRLTIGR